jgi:hypothetical protein
MEPEGSLLCSQEFATGPCPESGPATDPYPEPDASSPQFLTLFL